MSAVPLHTLSDLSENRIEYLHNCLFAQAQGIKTINLYSNQLRALPEGLLEFNPVLQRFSITHNLLTWLPLPLRWPMRLGPGAYEM